jgi:hypothetical protein
VGVLTFYRGSGERRGGVAGEFNAGVSGFNAIEDGGGFKRGFKGGEMKARRQWSGGTRGVKLGDAQSPESGGGAGELGHCPMKVTTPGSLTGWAHLSARGRRRPNRTSSEREATAESDKWSRPDREGGGGPWLGWKIRVEAGPRSRKRISEL